MAQTLTRRALTLALLAGTPAGAAALALPAFALLSSPSAIAQTNAAVTPYVVSVVADDADLRAGESLYIYSVAKLKAGTLLRVDAETADWLRVGYPDSARAIVAAEDVAPSADATTVKLRRPSKLSAFNVATGARASFMPLLLSELPPETSLKVIEAIKDDAGKVTHYAIQAPDSARAYISRSAVRRASDEETARFAGTPAPTPSANTTPTATTTPPTPAATRPTTVINNTPGEPAKNGNVVGATPAIGGRLEPTTPPAPVGETPPGFTRVPESEGTPATTEIVPEPMPLTPRPAVTPAPVSRTESLVALYNRVRQQPLENAELDEAIGEFRSYLDGLSGPDRERSSTKNLERYVKAMELRRELRNDASASAAARQSIDSRVVEVRRRITELESQRVYTMIGRLVPSVVYDGERLPQLYRVESPEPGSARTLGYLQPDAKLDLAGKLGVVVGIEGDVRFDEALRANIITPRKIDQISLAPVDGRVISNEVIRQSTTTTTTTTSPGTTVPPANPASTTPAPATPSRTPESAPPVDAPDAPEGNAPAAPATTPSSPAAPRTEPATGLPKMKPVNRQPNV